MTYMLLLNCALKLVEEIILDRWALRNCRRTAGQSNPHSSGLRHCLESPVSNRPVMRPPISEERVRR